MTKAFFLLKLGLHTLRIKKNKGVLRQFDLHMTFI